jgi:phosphatidylglycerol:prolipoprotein diacylglycerol transferase
MYPTLIHIYGPLAIHSYGLMILIGLLCYTWLVLNNPRREKLLTKEQLFTILGYGIITGFVGGHLLYVLTENRTLQALVTPVGFSILGSVIGVILFLHLYLRAQRIPELPFFDLITTYAPIIQAFGRIGCFLAGCCYGSPTTLPWAITYTNPEVEAPLCVALHPSQLYSAVLLFGLTFLLAGVLQYRFKKPGQMLGMYLALISAERFFIDFFRYDHTALDSFCSSISPYQGVALLLFSFSLVLLWVVSRKKNHGAHS